MIFAVVLVVGAALFVLGVAAMASRRSMVGMLAGFELCCAALVVLACALFDLAGADPSTGQVIAVAIVGVAVASALLLVALHLSAARASRSAEDLEPW